MRIISESSCELMWQCHTYGPMVTDSYTNGVAPQVGVAHTAPDGAADETAFGFADVKVDLAARRVFRGDAEVHLTPNEYRLLTTLIRHAGKVCTHRQLLAEVWGPSHVEHGHYLRIYMAQLRQKLEADSTNPRYLRTEVGVGYRLLVE